MPEQDDAEAETETPGSQQQDPVEAYRPELEGQTLLLDKTGEKADWLRATRPSSKN
jgi:hypothetical protein